MLTASCQTQHKSDLDAETVPELLNVQRVAYDPSDIGLLVWRVFADGDFVGSARTVVLEGDPVILNYS